MVKQGLIILFLLIALMVALSSCGKKCYQLVEVKRKPMYIDMTIRPWQQ